MNSHTLATLDVFLELMQDKLYKSAMSFNGHFRGIIMHMENEQDIQKK